MNVIRETQILIVVGETGSGKSTQLIQYCYEEFTKGLEYCIDILD